MRRQIYCFGIRFGLFLSCLPLFCVPKPAAGAENARLEHDAVLATNLQELNKAVAPGSERKVALDLQGTVLAADRKSGTLLLQDSSSVAVLNLNLDDVELHPGQRIRLRGTNPVEYTETGLGIGTRPLVDVDGLHATVEKEGAVFLPAGRHSIQVKWFNWRATADLQVAYSGPGISRQSIPDSVLWQSGTTSETTNTQTLHGLRFRCFEGQWNKLPNFSAMTPKKTGEVSNFDVGVRTSPDGVGLEFRGYLDVPRDGDYTFYLGSDDGGQLFLDYLPSISVLGTVKLPDPSPIAAGEPLSSRSSLWAEVEGSVTFLNTDRRGVEFELLSGGSRMRVVVLSRSSAVPWHLLHSRVRVRGVCMGVRNTDGQECAGLLVAAGWSSVRILDLPSDQWKAFRSTTVVGLSNAVAKGEDGGIVRLHGELRTNVTTGELSFRDETGSVPIELLPEFSIEPETPVSCLCRWLWDGVDISLMQAVCESAPKESSLNGNTNPVLKTALQVQQLKPEEAERHYPVEIQGVITYVGNDSLVIQDSTRAVYVFLGDPAPPNLPHVGDECRIKGTALPGEFSPIVNFQEAIILGRGQKPAPVIPTRDQLLNGSLDAQYVELRGMLVATHEGYVTLLTAEGSFDLDISPGPNESWEALLNSIIRVRGCFFANWNKTTHRIVLDRPILRIWAAVVSIDVPAPTDMFQADEVRVAQLMHFDPRFNTFRRVKVRGQIVHSSPDVFYLMEDGVGLRFRPAEMEHFEPGDEVEVVGLVELGGASALLHQAVARKTGHAPLPEARQLILESPGDQVDSTLVKVEGTVVDVKNSDDDQILEIQIGVKRFAARLSTEARSPRAFQIGSQVRLTGVFHSLNGNQMTDAGVGSFELLLNTPEDARVIARAPWWTSRRLMVTGAALGAGLLFAVVWIALLRQQVERRTVQLRHEIGEKERAEKIRAVEQERSRIARDLHDDLGSGLTEISMMASANPGFQIEPETAVSRLKEIGEKSRSMVSALEGVVWVTNARNDTLSALVEYLASSAEEFLARARISCRIELPTIRAERMIAAEIRHDVLLAVREALNNAVRHGHPREVLLRFVVSEDALEIMIKDDGCGFEVSGDLRKGFEGNGLGNLHNRMHKMGGVCQITSSVNAGTSVILQIPVHT